VRDVLIGALAALILVLVNDAYVVSKVGILHGPLDEGTGFSLAADHLCYIAMAQESFEYYNDPEAHTPPFCYRLLTPWAARLVIQLGAGTDLAFYLLTQVGLCLFLTLLFLLLRGVGLDLSYSLLGIVLAAGMQGAVRWYSLQYWMTDPLALCFLTLGVHLVRTRRWGLLQATSVLAMLNKDTYLMLFPYVFFSELRCAGWRAACSRTVQVAWLPMIVMQVAHSYIVPLESKSFYETVKPIFLWRVRDFFQLHVYAATIGSFGVLMPLLLLFPSRLLRCVRGNYPELILALGFFAVLGVATNTDREMAYTLPALLPIAMINVRSWVRATRTPFALVALALVAVQALFWMRTVYFESSIQLLRWDVVAAVTSVWIVGLVSLRARRKALVREA